MSKNTKNSGRSQSNFVRFMFLTGLGGILILLLMFVVLFSAMSKKDEDVQKQNPVVEEQTSLEDKKDEKLREEKEEITGIVVKSAENNSITILNIEDEKEVNIETENGTQIKDIYGNAMSLKEFKVGDIIKTKYNKSSMKAEFIRISGEAWEKKGITNVSINLENSNIRIGNDLYEYTNNLIATYNKENISLDKITSVDELTIRGYKNKVWFINVDKSHGYITIIPSNTEEEATVEIDNNIYMSIKEANNILISEGNHKIVIKKEGYEPIVENINLNYMENLEIRLDNMKKKVGNLIVTSNNVSDYKVFINDIEYPGEQPILLEYGEYRLLVKKEGYKDWNKELKINQENIKVNVELEKDDIPKTAKVLIDTNPEEAEVYIDDTFIGISPIEEEVPYGEHKISIIKDGYSPLNIPINIEENQKKRNLIFTLQKISEIEYLEENR